MKQLVHATLGLATVGYLLPMFHIHFLFDLKRNYILTSFQNVGKSSNVLQPTVENVKCIQAITSLCKKTICQSWGKELFFFYLYILNFHLNRKSKKQDSLDHFFAILKALAARTYNSAASSCFEDPPLLKESYRHNKIIYFTFYFPDLSMQNTDKLNG